MKNNRMLQKIFSKLAVSALIFPVLTNFAFVYAEGAAREAQSSGNSKNGGAAEDTEELLTIEKFGELASTEEKLKYIGKVATRVRNLRLEVLKLKLQCEENFKKIMGRLDSDQSVSKARLKETCLAVIKESWKSGEASWSSYFAAEEDVEGKVRDEFEKKAESTVKEGLAYADKFLRDPEGAIKEEYDEALKSVKNSQQRKAIEKLMNSPQNIENLVKMATPGVKQFLENPQSFHDNMMDSLMKNETAKARCLEELRLDDNLKVAYENLLNARENFEKAKVAISDYQKIIV